MDIEEEVKKIGANGPMRYAVLFIGLSLLLFSQCILTWKNSSEQDARGQISAIQLQIGELERDISDTDDKAKKSDLGDEIKDLTEKDMVDARIEAAGEQVDAKSNIWITSMIKMLGLVIASFGLLILAATGGSHEKIGALVALGFIITRL